MDARTHPTLSTLPIALLALVALLASCEDGGHGPCAPDCGARECGPVPNGCGESCGACTEVGEACLEAEGRCEPVPLTTETLGAQILQAYCGTILGCQAELGPSFPTRERCLEIMGLALADSLEVPVFLARGNSLYALDEAQARACLARISGAACADSRAIEEEPFVECSGGSAGSGAGLGDPLLHLLERFAECREAVTGALARDACCDGRGGCGPGLYCEQVGGPLGTCLPAGAAGESCATRPCQAGLACARSALADVCAPYLTLDQACDAPGGVCADGLFCDALQVPARCQTADRAAGAECVCHACAPGLYCAIQEQPPVCRAFGQEGGACASAAPCGPGLACAAGSCRRLTLLELGEVCHPELEELCPGALGWGWCADDGAGTDRCRAPGLEDQACDPQGDLGEDCALFHDLQCDPASGTCRPLPALGQGCTVFCADFYDVYCAYAAPTDPAGICKTRVEEGGDCSQGLEAEDILSACRLGFECDGATRTCEAEETQPQPTCP